LTGYRTVPFSDKDGRIIALAQEVDVLSRVTGNMEDLLSQECQLRKGLEHTCQLQAREIGRLKEIIDEQSE